MKLEKTTVLYKCDGCGHECIPVRSIRVLTGYALGDPCYFKLDGFSLQFPYTPPLVDICRSCINKYLLALLKESEGND